MPTRHFVDVFDPVLDPHVVDVMNLSPTVAPLSDLSERELLTELVVIEEQIRERLPSDGMWRGEPSTETELLALFLRERAVSRHLHAERAATAPRYA